jgi:peptidoglycan/LPS O-acetylase OafA/YrhL
MNSAAPALDATSPPRREAAELAAGRVPALDGLRGLAIALVLVFHYYVETYTLDNGFNRLAKRIFAQTGSGVDLFFVLSGFLIGGIVLDRGRARNFAGVFYARRALRILPLYALLLATFFIAASVPALRAIEGGIYFGSAVPRWSYVVFLQNGYMAALRSIGPWWLAVTWSLAIEEQFYLALPWLARRATPRAILWGCGTAFGLSIALRCGFAFGAGNLFGVIYFPAARLDGLVVGVAIAVLVRQPLVAGWLAHQRAALGFAAAILALVAMEGLPFIDDPRVSLVLAPLMFALAFGVLLLAVLTNPQSPVARWLSRPAWTFLGGISYFAYLFHLPVLFTVHGLIFRTAWMNDSVGRVAATVLALVLTLAAATVSRRWLELPLLSLGHRRDYQT